MILKIHFGTNTLPNLYTQTDEKYVKNVYLTEKLYGIQSTRDLKKIQKYHTFAN